MNEDQLCAYWFAHGWLLAKGVYGDVNDYAERFARSYVKPANYQVVCEGHLNNRWEAFRRDNRIHREPHLAVAL